MAMHYGWTPGDACAYAWLPGNGDTGECRLNPPVANLTQDGRFHWDFPEIHIEAGPSGCAKGKRLTDLETEDRWDTIAARNKRPA